MIPVKEITITRAEGLNCGRTKKFSRFSEANGEMSSHSHTYPKMGYDKHQVKVVWEDGTEYDFRLDAQHPENQYYSGNWVNEDLHRSMNFWTDPECKLKDECQGAVSFFTKLKEGGYEV